MYILQDPITGNQKELDEKFEKDAIDMLLAKGWKVLKKEVI